MSLWKTVLKAGLLSVFLVGTAVAAPKNGFGLNGGLVHHSRDCGCLVDSSSGISIGIDYQFALSEHFTLSPFLMSSGETGSSSDYTLGHGIFGAQLRYWAGDWFFGGHVGRYSEYVEYGGFSTSVSAGGAGLVAGWEGSDGGLYGMGQLDSTTVNYFGTDIKLSAFRLSVGYRWK
jgi:hypothetical protein